MYMYDMAMCRLRGALSQADKKKAKEDAKKANEDEKAKREAEQKANFLLLF